MVSIPPSVGPDLAHWRNPHTLSAQVRDASVNISVFTDASLSVWGGRCLSQVVGRQQPAHMSLHINMLELLTVWKVIQHFVPLLQNQHVLICTDNKAKAAYINQQGGVRSARLLNMVERNLAFSAVKTYAAAISSCHEGLGDRSVFCHPLMKRFLRGVRRHRPVSRSLAPQWDLALVLRMLIKAPFEPLDQVPLKFLSAKTALLLALTSTKRVSDLPALSVAPSCLRIQGDGNSAVLQPQLLRLKASQAPSDTG